MPDDTLLGHLGVALKDRAEVLATRSLAYILRGSQTARHALAKFLKNRGARVPEGLRYRHQDSAKGAMPDVVGRDRSGREAVIIEGKFWANLTEQQPCGYLSRLPARQGGVVLFVAPALRKESLWADLLRCCPGGARKRADGADETRTLRLAGGRLLMLTSWRALLSVLLAELDAAGDSAMAADIRQLQGLCDRMDAGRFLPMREEEFGPEIPQRICRLCVLVDEVFEMALEAGFARRQRRGGVRLRTGARATYYGRFLYLGRIGAWFGVHYEWWAEKRSTPLWVEIGPLDFEYTAAVQLRQRRRLKYWEDAEPSRLLMSDDGTCIIPLDVPVGKEEGEVKRALLSQLKAIAQALKG